MYCVASTVLKQEKNVKKGFAFSYVAMLRACACACFAFGFFVWRVAVVGHRARLALQVIYLFLFFSRSSARSLRSNIGILRTSEGC